MEKRFRITVEGKPYIVVVEDLTASGSQGLYPEPGSMAAAQVTPPATPPAGAAAAPPAAAVADAGPGDEVAPLAGVVQAVHVTLAQAIGEGDRLVSLEAMKMVTHVFARRAGKVTHIAVKPGDPVDVGQVLLGIG